PGPAADAAVDLPGRSRLRGPGEPAVQSGDGSGLCGRRRLLHDRGGSGDPGGQAARPDAGLRDGRGDPAGARKSHLPRAAGPRRRSDHGCARALRSGRGGHRHRSRRRPGAAAGLPAGPTHAAQRHRLHPDDLLAVHHDAAPPPVPGLAPAPRFTPEGASWRAPAGRAVYHDRWGDSAVSVDVRGFRGSAGSRGPAGAALRPRGESMSRTVLIATGSYSSIERGRGRGVELLSLEVGDHADGHDTALMISRRAAVELPDPSFVLWSPDGSLLYAVLETAPTRVV